MDYKFLDKVVDQIVSETEVDHEEWRVSYPFTQPVSFNNSLTELTQTTWILYRSPSSLPLFVNSFIDHCRDVYGLNGQELVYVWNVYKHIIKDKIENNG